jgi:hypothetical protein
VEAGYPETIKPAVHRVNVMLIVIGVAVAA